jgi:hypothetical protein
MHRQRHTLSRHLNQLDRARRLFDYRMQGAGKNEKKPIAQAAGFSLLSHLLSLPMSKQSLMKR